MLNIAFRGKGRYGKPQFQLNAVLPGNWSKLGKKFGQIESKKFDQSIIFTKTYHLSKISSKVPWYTLG